MEAVLVQEGAVVSYETVADPEPKPGEALVELKAAAVNRRDLLVRQGVYPFPLPLIPGGYEVKVEGNDVLVWVE